MSNRFNLTIKLGNDAMQTPYDVAEALRDAAQQIDMHGDMSHGRIFDANGNRVGEWGVTK